MRVFIYGSCVTRDSEPWFSEFGLKMIGYVARQSLVSAFRPADVSEYKLEKISSSFQRRMAKGDIQGHLRFQIRDSKPDVVFWDICDERLGVKKAPSGGMITHSRDHVGEGIHPGPFGPIMKFGEDEHFLLWERGLDQLLSEFSRNGLSGSLYLNATPWAVVDESGLDHEGQAGVAEAFNRAAERYLTLAEHRGVHVVRLPAEAAISRSNGHQWGPAPFHYTDTTYRRMLEGLTSALNVRP